MTEEEKYIIDQFGKNILACYQRIAIYGIGKNTELLLRVYPEAPVIGLLDSAYDGAELFGRRMLCDKDITKENIDVIVIVARKSVQGIIYPRIAKYENEGIRIVNVEGENIGKQEIYVQYNIPEYSVNYEDVKKIIENKRVISFDLFDTLIMRRVLNPCDIFACAVRRMQLSDARQKQLVRARMMAEKEAKALKGIDEIYEELAQSCHLDNEEAKTLKRLEFELEKENIVGRKECISLLEYARKLGKQIYILTDMYYRKADLKILCDLSGVAVDENEILSSCEIGCTKEAGNAYQFLIDKGGGNAHFILHIGDNPINDYKKAKEYSIDAIRILSGYEMLVHSSMASLLSDTVRYEKRCAVGLLTARLFNNPFALNETKGKVSVTRYQDAGYVFGVIFYSFCKWLIEKALEAEIEMMILPGRDGYLIEKCFDILKPPFKYVYIAASRRCYELALLSSAEDVDIIVNNTDFKGSREALIVARYGIKRPSGCTENEWITLILKEATEQREALRKYFRKKGIYGDCKTGVFDCVASGTVHMYLEKLLGRQIQGFYFGVKLPQKSGISIVSAFGTLTDYEVRSAVLEHYLLWECMLSPMTGTLIRFEGEHMIFENNMPSAHLSEIQNGILQFVEDANRLFEKDLVYCNELVKCIFNGVVAFKDEIREIFTYDDSYLGEKNRVRIWQ